MIRIIILMSALISCAGVKNNSTPNCGKELKLDISQNWKFETNYYHTSTIFKSRLDTVYRNCILQMNKQEIIDLFGNPSSIDSPPKRFRYPLSLTYLISSPPKDVTADGATWHYLIFYVDSTNLIKRFEEWNETITIEK